jgi:aminomuconate-semialdehyde/2-hydroxymuconate-6-semialdehyde dehydrogenase
MLRLKNFINGEFLEPKSGRYLSNFDPATGKIYAESPDSDALDVVLAIQAANKAFAEWSETPAKERAKILFKIADILEAKINEFAEAESKDVGKPLWLAREADIPRAISNFRFFASAIITKQEMAADIDGQFMNYVLRQPIGVCGLISPWNLPLYLLTWKLAPCLATGNVAVCKPSEVTPMTAFMLASVLQEAGLPPGVCNIIFGKGESAGAPLVSHPGVPVISFTGGTETGVAIAKLAAPHFKKLSLELGGKNANIIFKDADLKKAVATSIRSSFLNSGQICLCGSRVLVQQDIYDEFMTEFKKQTQEIVVGDPKAVNTFMGPLVSLEQLQKVTAVVEQAKKENGKISVGGEPLKLEGEFADGYYFKPTIIEDLTNCSELWQTEIFGPVVTVMPFKYENDAVKWANTSSYGLSSSLWTQDLTRGHRVAAKIKAGTVWINTWMQRDLRVPFGGMKQSGLGREGGNYSIDFFTESKNICIATR